MFAETYTDDTTGAEMCAECEEEVGNCGCTCDDCGDNIHECACGEKD